MTDQEIEKRLEEIFAQNYELLKMEGGHALTEAGQKVGFGHLSRCTAIYHAFVRRGIKPLMIVNGDEGISDFLKGVRHEVFDWLGSFQDLLSRIAAADIELEQVVDYLEEQMEIKHE